MPPFLLAEKGNTKRKKPDRKAIAEMDEIQNKYDGRAPEYITMLFAKRLNCLATTLAILTGIHIYLLFQ